MEKKIRQISNHYIICGHGRTGSTICLKLHERGIPFVVIEADPKHLELAMQRGYPVVNGDAKSDQTLISAGIKRASGIVAIIPDDSTALLISMAARELNPDINIIVQGSEPKIEKRLYRAGADRVVYPLSLGGEQIARLIAQKQNVPISDYEESLDWDVQGYYLKVFKYCEEPPLSIQSLLSMTKAVSAVSHLTNGQSATNNPSPQTIVNNGDSLVLVMSKSIESCQTKE
jgi:voltage-gated potassium channel Kch